MTELRRFGLSVGAVIAIAFGLVLPLIRHGGVYPIPLAIGGGLILWAVVHPCSLRFVHRPWMALARVLARVNTAVILTVFFYLVITPMGLLLRLLGKGPTARIVEPETESYRKPSQQSPPQQMEKPY